MPNLIIKSSSTSKAFNVQQKLLRMPLDDKSLELLITPKEPYSINANDFNVGLLPPEIRVITYENIGKNVVAKIIFRGKIDSPTNKTIDPPISGKGIIGRDEFKIIENTFVGAGILTSSHSPYSKTTIDNTTTYRISSKLNKKVLIFSKTFTTINNFSFSQLPTYVINGNKDRYIVTTKIKKDANDNIVSKTFNFYYKSPKLLNNSTNTEIEFSATANDPSPTVKSLTATKIEENVIYSINKGRNVGPQGGFQRMVVKGVPGTTFSLLVSNSNGEMYNEDTGAFSGDGQIIKGVIPKSTLMNAYGESVIRIKVPRSSSATTISTQFIKEEAVQTTIAKLKAATTVEEIKIIQSGIKTQETITSSLTSPGLTFTVNMTGGYVGPKVTLLGASTTTTQIYLSENGVEVLKTIEIGTLSFDFEVAAGTDHKVIQLSRQPLFTMPTYVLGTSADDNFVAWDSGSNKQSALTSTGVEIPSDWDWGVFGKDTDITMNVKADGVGSILSEDSGSIGTMNSYSSIRVKGIITVKNVGDTAVSVDLKLNNFLSIITPS